MWIMARGQVWPAILFLFYEICQRLCEDTVVKLIDSFSYLGTVISKKKVYESSCRAGAKVANNERGSSQDLREP